MKAKRLIQTLAMLFLRSGKKRANYLKKHHILGGVKHQTSKTRDERVDSVKFWLVVLVITVHLVMRKEFAGSEACVVLWNWICLFSMQLFIFISGYLSQKKDTKDFWSSILKLAVPLIFFHIIALAFYVEKPIDISTILSPWYMLWYLLSLICWRCLLQFIPDNILRNKRLVLCVIFCISILAGFLPFDRTLSLQRTLAFMPFFFLGYYMKGRNLFLPDRYKWLSAAFLILILAILFLYPHRFSFLLFATPYKSILGAAIRIAVSVVAIPMSLAFMNVCYKAPWVARQGRMTLQYYIYHGLLIPPNSSLIIPPLIALATALNIPMTFATAVVIIIVTAFLIALALKVPYIKMLTNPSSLLIQNTKS